MVDKKKYGVVYTPDKLAEFTAELLYSESKNSTYENMTILDPACGESALLFAMKKIYQDNAKYIGIDIDKQTIEINRMNGRDNINYYQGDFLCCMKEECTFAYWMNKMGKIDLLIANPPWSCERLYSREELVKEGYTLIDGQYDNYFLFIEQSINLMKDGGSAAFILPDSLFSNDAIKLRKLLCKTTNILVIARLGEKIFPNVNRATTVIVIRKEMPTKQSKTKCFRLGTKERKQVLNNEVKLMDCFLNRAHEVKQTRFDETEEALFDIDLYENEEKFMLKLEQNNMDWSKTFSFGRGVEISKSGNVVICKHCNLAQGYSKMQANLKTKNCVSCGKKIQFEESNIMNIISEEKMENMEKIFVGENIQRYYTKGNRYIKLGVDGINYKNESLYLPPKILIRKTGLGINAFLDNESTYISQTIYSCQFLDKEIDAPIEYYLALLNSRVVYYYYLKKYGENEWKSHPYLTKKIIFSLPLKKYCDTGLTNEICQLAQKLLIGYDRQIDIMLEKKIFELYELSYYEILMVMDEINKLPDLSAINGMKFSKEEMKKCTDI